MGSYSSKVPLLLPEYNSKAISFKYLIFTQIGDAVKSGCENSLVLMMDYSQLPKVDLMSLGEYAL